jgi:hypothetical protein
MRPLQDVLAIWGVRMFRLQQSWQHFDEIWYWNLMREVVIARK